MRPSTTSEQDVPPRTPTVFDGAVTDFDPSPYETTLDPARATHLGLWRSELVEPSSRYFHWDLPALPGPYVAAMEAGETAGGPGLSIDRVVDLCEPGYCPIETGISRSADDSLCVAVWTAWPGTTPTMVDWWFGWHIARTDRYKLWHPQAHVFAQPRFDLSSVTGLTDRQRYVGNTSWVDEYIGPFLTRLAITFDDPAEFGIGDDDPHESSTAICATVRDSDTGVELSRLVHAVRRTDFGAEMRSRFFFPPGTPAFVGPPMLEHCATEMSNLAEFLPRLYADEHGAAASPLRI